MYWECTNSKRIYKLLELINLTKLLDARSNYKVNLYIQVTKKLENEIYKNSTIYNRIQKIKLKFCNTFRQKTKTLREIN